MVDEMYSRSRCYLVFGACSEFWHLRKEIDLGFRFLAHSKLRTWFLLSQHFPGSVKKCNHWKVWGVRPKWGEKNPFKNMRKHGKLGKIMEDNEKIWQHDKGHKNMTIWEFDSLRELWLKLLSQCAWMVSSTSLQCQGLRFVQSLWADPSHVILKGESGQQWSPVSCRSKHLQMNGLQMAGSHRGQGRAGSRPSNIFKYLQMN